jgi:hypothetical protein
MAPIKAGKIFPGLQYYDLLAICVRWIVDLILR